MVNAKLAYISLYVKIIEALLYRHVLYRLTLCAKQRAVKRTVNNMDKLKPCPFCGNIAWSWETMAGESATGCNVLHPAVENPCGAYVIRMTKEESEAVWNRREYDESIEMDFNEIPEDGE